MDVRTVWDGNALLGEGPVWDAQAAVLWFVDIKGPRVHRLDPATGEAASWPAPAQIGWVLPAGDGMLLAGLQTGLSVFDAGEGSFRPVCVVEPDLPTNRLNDAVVAADGAVWFGSMDDGEANATGRFYRWDGADIESVAIDPVSISNGPAVSPDGRTLYYVDTAGGVIHAADIDDRAGVAGHRRFATIDPADGSPDGVSTDAAGNVWVGLWGGWRARLYSPGGDIVREVRLPVANVTKVALGGPDLRTAYATTASVGLDEAARAAQPGAGNVFAFDVEVGGLAKPPARLDLRPA